MYQIRIERDARHDAERVAREQALRSQAQLISGWYGEHVEGSDQDQTGRDWLVVLNGSSEPVYEAVATLVFIQGTGPRRGEAYPADPPLEDYRSTMALIPPGRWRTTIKSGWGHMQAQPAVEVAFTDRAGNHWIRRATGALDSIPTNGVDYYGLIRPRTLGVPSPFPPNS